MTIDQQEDGTSRHDTSGFNARVGAARAMRNADVCCDVSSKITGAAASLYTTTRPFTSLAPCAVALCPRILLVFSHLYSSFSSTVRPLFLSCSSFLPGKIFSCSYSLSAPPHSGSYLHLLSQDNNLVLRI